VLRGSGVPDTAHADSIIPEEHREVSAVMLALHDPQAGIFLDQAINRQGKTATLAWPIGRVMADLFGKIGWMNNVLAMIAYLVVVVAAGSVLASLYNTMNERRREFAILRSLGARRGGVLGVVRSGDHHRAGALADSSVRAIIGAAYVVVRRQVGWCSMLAVRPVRVGAAGHRGDGALSMVPAPRLHRRRQPTAVLNDACPRFHWTRFDERLMKVRLKDQGSPSGTTRGW
jgi:hypothetical protein